MIAGICHYFTNFTLQDVLVHCRQFDLPRIISRFSALSSKFTGSVGFKASAPHRKNSCANATKKLDLPGGNAAHLRNALYCNIVITSQRQFVGKRQTEHPLCERGHRVVPWHVRKTLAHHSYTHGPHQTPRPIAVGTGHCTFLQ